MLKFYARRAFRVITSGHDSTSHPYVPHVRSAVAEHAASPRFTGKSWRVQFFVPVLFRVKFYRATLVYSAVCAAVILSVCVFFRFVDCVKTSETHLRTLVDCCLVWLVPQVVCLCTAKRLPTRIESVFDTRVITVGSWLWSPYVIGQTIIFSSCSFFLLSFFLSSFFPRLISAVGDWMSTILLHMAWP